MTKTLLRQ